MSDIGATSSSITNMETEDAFAKTFQKFPIDEDVLHKLQQEDAFCTNILNQIEKGNIAMAYFLI